MKRAALLLLLTAGCATNPGVYERQEPADQARLTAQQELERSSHALDGLLAAEARPLDCTRAAQLRDNICSLAERICTLGARPPEDPSACADARTRCKSARDRVLSSCPGRRN
jgi:hypothetical protein